jgi:serine/threonine-protein kinase HipA
MCTRLYPGLSPEFAFAVGGEATPGEMGAEHLALLARQLGMQPRFLLQQAREMAERLPPAVQQALQELAPALSPSAQTLAGRLERFVQSATTKLAARLSTPSS